MVGRRGSGVLLVGEVVDTPISPFCTGVYPV